jgi:low affinity Fe/Cu permease
MLKRKFFMFLLFFLMLLTVSIFLGPVMFGDENQEVVAIFITVKLIVFNKFIQLHQIIKVEVDALHKNERRE